MLCIQPNKVRFIKLRRLEWAGHLVRIKEVRNSFNILTSKPLGRASRRRVDNIRIDPTEIRDIWIDSAQDRDYWRASVCKIFKIRVP